jgi:hypothetical protein
VFVAEGCVNWNCRRNCVVGIGQLELLLWDAACILFEVGLELQQDVLGVTG